MVFICENDVVIGLARVCYFSLLVQRKVAKRKDSKTNVGYGLAGCYYQYYCY